MQEVKVPEGRRAVHELRLAAGEEHVIAFTRIGWAANANVEIVSHDGAARVYYTLDGTEAEIRGGNAYVVPAAICAPVQRAPGRRAVTEGRIVVRMISEGSPLVSVQVLP